MISESTYSIDPTELSCGARWLSAVSKPVLTLVSGAVCFSLVRLASGLHTERLPAGFSALDMHTGSITIQCSNAPSRLRLPTPEEAARELCLIFAGAPASYRRFSVHCSTIFALIIHLAAPGGRLQPRQGLSATVYSKVLAEHMRACAGEHGMSIAVLEEPGKPNMFEGMDTVVLHRL